MLTGADGMVISGSGETREAAVTRPATCSGRVLCLSWFTLRGEPSFPVATPTSGALLNWDRLIPGDEAHVFRWVRDSRHASYRSRATANPALLGPNRPGTRCSRRSPPWCISTWRCRRLRQKRLNSRSDVFRSVRAADDLPDTITYIAGACERQERPTHTAPVAFVAGVTCKWFAAFAAAQPVVVSMAWILALHCSTSQLSAIRSGARSSAGADSRLSAELRRTGAYRAASVIGPSFQRITARAE